jgi:DNA-directed RNA polymerase specialized sigma24 family protein
MHFNLILENFPRIQTYLTKGKPMTPPDWDRLYDATIMGNEAEFNALFQKLSAFLLSVAQSHLKSKPEIAEEAYGCVQEADLAIWQAIQKRKGPQHRRAMCSWCTRIVIHKVLDLLRRYGYLDHHDHVAPESQFEELEEETAIVEEPGKTLIDKLVQQEIIGSTRESVLDRRAMLC